MQNLLMKTVLIEEIDVGEGGRGGNERGGKVGGRRGEWLVLKCKVV